jgi:cytoskeletal protein CcmA (bactofilin family)
MFTKTPSDSPTSSKDSDFPSTEASVQALRRAGQKLSSLIAGDMTLEGNITGGGDLQIDGTIKGDVRVERVTVSENGQVEGGIFAEAVEVRGKVGGSISAKEVKLYDGCKMDGDITHERLSVESGASFQGKSMRLKPAAAGAQASQGAGAVTKPAETPTIVRKDPPSPFAPKENGGASTTPKSPTAI